MKARLLAIGLGFFLHISLVATYAQNPGIPSPQDAQQLTIEAIYADGGLLGRAPEAVQWSPDGSKVSYVQRDDSGEHGALYYIDLATGKPAVLVSSEKLASLAPPASSSRKRETTSSA